ncbi:catechol O-methyltransferase [Exophiala viscosa]|uniref:Catechol O-methyltransferase n=1 Tax=Exophiala viscosa TaxID=2486360 RepID=A0AAN6DNW4_9EURO|nr:catechol O-methyltransferase [Exophiala viscosa]
MDASTLTSLVSELSALTATYVPSIGHDAPSQASKAALLNLTRKIQHSLMDPAMMVQAHSLQMAEMVSVRTLLDLKVFEKMPTDESQRITAKGLSEQSGVQQALLERLLRPLVASGFITQSADGSYGSTKFSQAYISFPGLFFTLMFDHFLQPMTDLPKYLAKHGTVEPTSFYVNPYSDYHNASDSELTTWEIMSKDPEKLKTFQIGLTTGDAMVPATGYYDFNQLALTEEELEKDPDRVSLVDIGGGVGNVVKRVLGEYKTLKPEHVVLEDLESIIEMAKKEETVPEGVRMLKHDFWTEQPVKGAKAYYFRRVFHDYSDELCVKLLKQVIPAMTGPDSRVLVADMLLPEIMTTKEAHTAALDIACMVMGGKERTEEDFRRLFQSVGLEVVAIHRAPGVAAGLVEGTLKS